MDEIHGSFGPSQYPYTVDATSKFKATFNKAGTYTYTIEIQDATTFEVLCDKTITITVNDPKPIEIDVVNGWSAQNDGSTPQTSVIDGYNTYKLTDAADGYANKKDAAQALTNAGTTIKTNLYINLDEYQDKDIFYVETALNDALGQTVADTQWNVMMQKSDDAISVDLGDGTVESVITESGDYTCAFTAYQDGKIEFNLIHDGQTIMTGTKQGSAAEPIRYTWIFGATNADGHYELTSPVYVVIGKANTNTDSDSSTNNVVSTWDDGGPFTTDAAGNVYDRWGNEIWHNPNPIASGKTYIGYYLVSTSDR